jgi:hypothetical protein
MAEIKVDKKDERYREDDHKERRFPWWLLAIPLLGLLLLPSLWNDRDDRATVDTQRTASAVTYEGDTWQAAGNPVRLEDNQLRVVGRTADGQSIFASAAGGGGGAGDRVEQHYLRLNDGLYQPLRQYGVGTGEE